MLKTQENKFTMIESVFSFLEDNQAVFAHIDEIVEHKDALKSKRDEISNKEDERMNVKKGKRESKVTTRNQVSQLAAAVSGAVYAFAKKTNNIELREKSDLTLNDLLKIRDSELPITLNAIKDMAAENVNSLSGYGVTAATLSELEIRILKYSAAFGSKESSGATKKGAVKSLKLLFDEAISIIESIDKLSQRFREENTQFYNSYRASRMIKNMGVRHLKEKKKVEKTEVK